MSISCADIPRLPGLESIRFRAGLSGGQKMRIALARAFYDFERFFVFVLDCSFRVGVVE